MTRPKCPGMDSRNWRPEDIFEIPCPACGKEMEFFKTDVRLLCPACGTRVLNPKKDLGCAVWCVHGKSCLAEKTPPNGEKN